MTWKGWEDFDPAKRPGWPDPAPPKRRKYGNVPTTVDGHTFASQREADRYRELLLLQKAGKISDLAIQPRFPLTTRTPYGGVMREIGNYVADFQFLRDGELVIEDAKGVRTALYKWKKKHAELQYGITIVEV